MEQLPAAKPLEPASRIRTIRAGVPGPNSRAIQPREI